MSHFCLRLFVAIIGTFFLITSVSLRAQDETTTTIVTPQTTTEEEVDTTTPEGVERHVIITTVPAAKEVIITPKNFSNCFQVEGWFGNIWVPKHNICLYKNSPYGAVWIEGYWACIKYKSLTGDCINWDWKSARWVY